MEEAPSRPFQDFIGGKVSISNYGFGLRYTTVEKFNLQIDSCIEYLIVDRLALGVAFGFVGSFTNREVSDLSVGPSLTYHFWDQDRFSAYARTSYEYRDESKRGSASPGAVAFGGGLNYHFDRWFGMGPYLRVSAATRSTGGTLGLFNLFFYL